MLVSLTSAWLNLYTIMDLVGWERKAAENGWKIVPASQSTVKKGSRNLETKSMRKADEKGKALDDDIQALIDFDSKRKRLHSGPLPVVPWTSIEQENKNIDRWRKQTHTHKH